MIYWRTKGIKLTWYFIQNNLVYLENIILCYVFRDSILVILSSLYIISSDS